MPAATARRSSSAARRKASSPAPKSTRRTEPPHPRFGISRIDSAATHGWFVRLGWRSLRTGKRPRFVSFFPDLRHGGKRKALLAAQAWVRYVLKWGRLPRK